MSESETMTATGRPTSAPGRSLLSAPLAWDAASAAQARRHARAAASELALDPAVQRACVLAASELVSNAVEHGTPPLRLRLWALAGGLRVEVEDASPAAPTELTVPLTAASGRGLAIVGAVSSTWGHYSTDSGKCVWCDVVASAATGPTGVAPG
jgi:anti-sigma regulatory factor (Ser/Thr protein kinase)